MVDTFTTLWLHLRISSHLISLVNNRGANHRNWHSQTASATVVRVAGCEIGHDFLMRFRFYREFSGSFHPLDGSRFSVFLIRLNRSSFVLSAVIYQWWNRIWFISLSSEKSISSLVSFQIFSPSIYKKAFRSTISELYYIAGTHHRAKASIYFSSWAVSLESRYLRRKLKPVISTDANLLKQKIAQFSADK